MQLINLIQLINLLAGRVAVDQKKKKLPSLFQKNICKRIKMISFNIHMTKVLAETQKKISHENITKELNVSKKVEMIHFGTMTWVEQELFGFIFFLYKELFNNYNDMIIGNI